MLGRTYFRERFAFILDLKSGQFQLLGIIGKVLTSMLYIYPFVVDYISFGVGYCLLQVVGSPEPQIGNSNSGSPAKVGGLCKKFSQSIKEKF